MGERKRLVLIIVLLMFIVVLGGCSNDGSSINSVNEEADVTALVEDFESDLSILSSSSRNSEEFQGVDAEWSADSIISFNFQGMSIEALSLAQFKPMFNEYVNLDELEVLNININNNTAQVTTKIVYQVTAMSNESELYIDLNLIKVSERWYIDNFIIRPEVSYTLSEMAETIVAINSSTNIEIKLPISSAWSEKSGSIDFNLSSAYYIQSDQAYFNSAIANSSAILIDHGIVKEGYVELDDIKSDSIDEHKAEIENISKEILNSLYKEEFTVQIADYEEDIVTDDIDDLIYDIQLRLNIDSPYFLDSAESLYADYKLRIAYKKYGLSKICLAVYAAPKDYYEEEIAAEIVNSFAVISN